MFVHYVRLPEELANSAEFKYSFQDDDCAVVGAFVDDGSFIDLRGTRGPHYHPYYRFDTGASFKCMRGGEYSPVMICTSDNPIDLVVVTRSFLPPVISFR